MSTMELLFAPISYISTKLTTFMFQEAISSFFPLRLIYFK